MEDFKRRIPEVMKSSGKPMRPGEAAKEPGMDSKEIVL
ncbi:MAG: hypothetical protein PWR13_1420 [Archaeoglobi archaeon]|nr:hypothetical protein [Archaeoglobi archaeon]MDK2782392.1 hypothetical protein [Archaeoglobi archaeon]